jgi:prepilin-type N-terminal cleavage/methylation domain-containing protein
MKKGFTLIELLAVIVILAVVALISVPLVLGVIDKVQKSSYEASMRSVFGAADLYIASSEFEVFPEEGINVVDTKIQMKNKNFTSGKIIKNEQGILELDKVSNGKYCAGGTINNIVIVTGSCDALDITPPTITITSNLVTSSSITIVASAEDLESGINGYQFSKDNGSTWTSKQISNVYNFTGLSNDTNYTFKVRVYNNNELSTLSEELIVRTNDIAIPTYSINTTDWTHEKIVTIYYPERQAGLVYEYSLDGATTWLLVESPSTTKEITFNDNGSVIARIADGTNEISGTSYQVTNIDKIAPVITVNPETVFVGLGSIYNDLGVTAYDDMLGDITGSIIKTGNVDTSTTGSYVLTYNVSDLAGNAAITKTRTVNVIDATFNFNYTGNSQTFNVPITGKYKIELWGAQGGLRTWDDRGFVGGKGALVQGIIHLSQNEILYVYVGGKGGDTTGTERGLGGYNGGGLGGIAEFTTWRGGPGGGGATDVRIGGTSLVNRIMIAAGGAGTASHNSGYHGGGLEGQGDYRETGYTGGTQTSGGAAWHNDPAYTNTMTPGTFGQGGMGGTTSSGSGHWAGSGGGGGYYGGGGGGINSSGGGGSSFISGHTGCNAVNSSSSHTGQPNHFSGYIFTESQMFLGIKDGNGYARITFISQ